MKSLKERIKELTYDLLDPECVEEEIDAWVEEVEQKFIRHNDNEYMTIKICEWERAKK